MRDNRAKVSSTKALKMSQQAAAPSDLRSRNWTCYIDTGWLWPVRETVQTARTFATQLSTENILEYIFAPQPQHYQFMKDQYPEIYAKSKRLLSLGIGARWMG